MTRDMNISHRTMYSSPLRGTAAAKLCVCVRYCACVRAFMNVCACLGGLLAGDPRGKTSLSHMYTHGKGVDVDLTRAFQLNLSAASDGQDTITHSPAPTLPSSLRRCEQ